MTATAPARPGPSPSEVNRLETIRFPVAGMTCGACVSRVTKALRRLDGVARVRVDLGREVAVVRRLPGRPSESALAAAITAAGYAPDLGAAEAVGASEADGLISRLFRRSR